MTICPKCNTPLKKGQVYCGKCGNELQFVADFEPEIEESIQEVLTNIVEEISEDGISNDWVSEDSLTITIGYHRVEEAPFELLDSDPPKTQKQKSTFHIFKTFMISLLGIFGAIFILIVFMVVRNYNSYDYQMQQANQEYVNLTFEESKEHVLRAIELAPNSSDAKMLLARIYLAQNNQQKAIQMLEGLLLIDPNYEQAYDELIPIYVGKKEYEKVNALLLKSTTESIVKRFSQYESKMPMVETPGGEYSDVIFLKFIASKNGKVHYTLDGSQPNKDSPIYSKPIRLDSGEYQIAAIFINEFGVKSDILEVNYSITIDKIEDPNITPESGTYDRPVTIAAFVPDDCVLYYTTDHSTPTQDSNLYQGPIPMPLDNSVFQFLLIDELGNPSNVISVEYTLQMQVNLTIEDAKNLLIQSLIQKGELLNPQLITPDIGLLKEYICDSAFSQDDQSFYLITEYQIQVDGKRSKTGNVYAVNVLTKELYKATTNYEGYYVVEAF